MYELLRNRRSIRKFQEEEVEKEKLEYILKSALLAPSSRSIRPWEFIVVTDKDLLQQLSQCKEHSANFLATAPLGIVVLADPEKCDVWVEDSSIASIIIQLACHSQGLGSCWIQVRERYGADQTKADTYVKKTLGIPDKYETECIIAVGYPAEEKKPYKDEDLLYNKIHYNSF